MKIAVFGWYGHNNAGDERIKYCLNHFLMGLGGIESVDFFDLHENAVKGATTKFNEYDLIIIGGGGLILSQHNYHDFILGLDTNVVTLGISVETTLKGNPKKFAQSLLHKCESVHVRDRGSYEKLKTLDIHNKVVLSSDLTFLHPFQSVQRMGGNNIGINLLPKPKYIKYSTLSNNLLGRALGILERFGGSNLLTTLTFKELTDFLKANYNCLPIPLYCATQDSEIPLYKKNDINFLREYFAKVPEIFIDQAINDCFAFISMRLHGSIFAVQKNIPVISFEYLPKNKNFMKEVGLEEFVLNGDNVVEARDLLERIDKNTSNIRERMSSYTESSKIKIQEHLIDIVNSLKENKYV